MLHSICQVKILGLIVTPQVEANHPKVQQQLLLHGREVSLQRRMEGDPLERVVYLSPDCFLSRNIGIYIVL